MKHIYLKIFFLLFTFSAYSQTDTEFWFAVPEVTWAHNPGGGEPTFLHISALNAAATVTIEMPREPAFTTIIVSLAPNTSQRVDLTQYVRDNYITGVTPTTGGTANDNNIIESGLPGHSGLVENRGIHITSSNLITVYLERNNTNNPDIWALKGANALGTEFVVPSQNKFYNQNMTPPALNAIDIVAVEDVTVYIYPTAAIQNVGPASAVSPYIFHLLKGQSLSCVANGRNAVDHLGGTYIATDITLPADSRGKIVVQWKDDSVHSDNSTCYDLSGDQVIPTSLAGDEYIVMRGELGNPTTNKNSEYAFVMAITPSTTVDFQVDGGVAPASHTFTSRGEIWPVLMNEGQLGTGSGLNINALHIKSQGGKPFIVFHVTGFGCEMGAAILPTIKGCTGSTEVSFMRSTTESFFLNIMCKTAHINDFYIEIPGAAANPYHFDPAWFIPIGTTGWSYLDKAQNKFSVAHGTMPAVPDGQVSRVYNTSGLFHLGLINGGSSSGCRYGYFSDFSNNYGNAVIASTGSDYIKFCYNDIIHLQASGGLAYLWEDATIPTRPDITFLDPKTISSPRVQPPAGLSTYAVTITRSCYLGTDPDTTIPVQAYGYPQIISDFTINSNADCCSPVKATYTNTSVGANKYEWTIEKPTGTVTSSAFTPPAQQYENTSYSTKTYPVSLKVSYANNCPDTKSDIVTVNPKITAKSSAGPKSGCQQDVTQTFTADTVGAGPFTSLYWNWGDGQELEILRSNITTLDFTHTFENLTNFDTTYYVFLVLIDAVHDCRDTAATHAVFVPGVARARFTVSNDKGCSPHTVLFENHSNGIVDYLWNFGNGSTSTTGNDTTITYFNTTTLPKNFYIDLTITKTNDDLTTCTDTYKDTIVVYPQFTTTISALPTEGCDPLTVNLSQTTVPNVATQFYWDLGDGSTSANSAPFTKKYQHTLNTDQVYHVTLITESVYGCRDTAPPVDITVYSYIDAHFTISDSVNCSPMTVSFTNNTSPNADVATSVWTDNGTSFVPGSTTFNRTFVNQTGTTQQHSIKLANTNTQGCLKEFLKVITVYPEITANFSRSDTLICHNSSITFTNTTIFTGVGTAVHSPQATFLWEFGDGSTSTSESPSHTFKNTENNGTTPQVFTVRLTVSVNGCSQIVSKTIRVKPEVKSIMQSSSYQVCTPANVVIENYSVGANEFTWQSSDGVLNSVLTDLSSVTWAADNSTLNDTVGRVITLTAKNGSCTSVSTKRFITYPHLVPAITSNVNSGCGPLDVQFTNASTGGTLTYAWNFADGDVGTQSGTFTHRFSNRTASDVTYNVTLKATNEAGCFLSTSKAITVFPEIEPEFSFEKSSECSPMPVAFNNSSLNGNRFEWYFGQPGKTDTVTTSHNSFSTIFSNTSSNGTSLSTYSVKLVTIDSNHPQCKDSVTRNVTIYPEVISNFSITENAQGCSPLTTTFENQSKGYGLYYDWNYVDGQSVTDSVIHHYTFINREATNKVYNVQLKVTDANGCTDISTHPVTAYPLVQANFTFEHNADKCSPFPVHFTNATLNGNRFEWNFNWQTSTTNPDTVVTNRNNITQDFDNLVANNILNYTLQLVSIDTNTNCKDQIQRTLEVYPHIVSKFVPDSTEACIPTIHFTNLSTGLANYIWDFGDGQSSVETNPVHVFNNYELNRKEYIVQLIAKQNATGCVDISDTTITAYSYVNAKFSLVNANESKSLSKNGFVGGCTPLKVTITDSSKVIGTWSWDFGDGVTSTSQQPGTRTYINTDKTYPLDNKPYTIKLRVENAEHCWDTTSQTIYVYPRSVPDFDVKAADCHPYNATFFDKSVVDDHSDYFWNLGDGSTITQKSFNHTYNNYSYIKDTVYKVKLITTTQYFCSDSIQKTVTVYPKPLARFESEIERYCPPFAANLMNVSKGNNLTFYWDFNNGQKVTTTDYDAQHPIFYNNTNEPKTYYIQLMAESGAGCRDTIVNQIHVYPNVVVGFTYNSAGCSPLIVNFKNTSNQPTEIYYWDFGNGSTSGVKNPIFRYVNASPVTEIYQVQLIGESIYGCRDTIVQPVTVYPAPVVDFAVTDPVHYYPDTTFIIQNLTNLGDWVYNWDFGDGNTSHETAPQFVYSYTGWGSNDNNNEFKIYLYADGEKCSSYDSAIVRIVPPMPEIAILDEPQGCVPLTVNFSITQRYTNQYFWDFDDGYTSNEVEPIHQFDSAGFFNVKLVVTGDGGSTYAYKVITVFPLPDVDFRFAPDYVMLPDQPVQFFNLTKNGYSYMWYFDTQGIFNVNDTASTENPSHLYQKQGEYIVRLEAWSINGCFSEITTDIPVVVSGEGAIEFPNTFLASSTSPTDGSYPSPDELNNVFHPMHHGVKNYELWIFNRWGEQVFYSDNVLVGWNGRYGNNGEELGQDVYFWKTKGQFQNGVPFKKAGDITLIRMK